MSPVTVAGRHRASALSPPTLETLPAAVATNMAAVRARTESTIGVEVCGRRCPVVGRVSMDQIVIDTGAGSVAVGTPATVFGPDGGATPTIQDWARWAGTIPHTVVTRIGSRVTRSVA